MVAQGQCSRRSRRSCSQARRSRSLGKPCEEGLPGGRVGLAAPAPLVWTLATTGTRSLRVCVWGGWVGGWVWGGVGGGGGGRGSRRDRGLMSGLGRL